MRDMCETCTPALIIIILLAPIISVPRVCGTAGELVAGLSKPAPGL